MWMEFPFRKDFLTKMETIKFLYSHFRRYRWQILFLGAISLVSSVIGGLGIGALIPLLSLLKGEGDVPNDLITQSILGFFNYLPFSYTLYSLLAIIVEKTQDGLSDEVV